MEQRAKRIVSTLALSLLAGLGIGAVKVLYGHSSGNLAFLADGVHCFFDAGAIFTGMVSVLLSSKPPDEGHPYGHRKIETISSVLLGLLLFGAAYEVGSLAYARLKGAPVLPEFSWGGVAILVGAVLVNLGVSRVESEQANESGSSFLSSDALHNRSDMLISLAVLLSLVAARFGLSLVDPVVSLLITAYLVYIALRLLIGNLQPLMDHSVLDPLEVQRIASSIDGVIYCHHIRSRGEKGHHFLDLNLHLPGHISLERAHEITHTVEARLKEAFPGLVDVVIHTEPDGHPPCKPDGA